MEGYIYTINTLREIFLYDLCKIWNYPYLQKTNNK